MGEITRRELIRKAGGLVGFWLLVGFGCRAVSWDLCSDLLDEAGDKTDKATVSWDLCSDLLDEAGDKTDKAIEQQKKLNDAFNDALEDGEITPDERLQLDQAAANFDDAYEQAISAQGEAMGCIKAFNSIRESR